MINSEAKKWLKIGEALGAGMREGLKNNKYCIFCGKQTNTKHHLIFGVSLRKLADQDGLWVVCCDDCHNLATKPHDRIHGNSMAEKLSKMLGQALWEMNEVSKSLSTDDDIISTEKENARINFIKQLIIKNHMIV